MSKNSYKRIVKEIAKLEAKEQLLPRGYIRTKDVNGKNYTYLQYRDHDRVKSVYINRESTDVIKQEICERKSIEEELRKLKLEKSRLERELGIHNYVPEKNVNYKDYLECSSGN